MHNAETTLLSWLNIMLLLLAMFAAHIVEIIVTLP